MPFNETLFKLKYWFKKNSIYILTILMLINSNNFVYAYEIKINPIYDQVRVFINELAPVEIDNRWGFINKKGELIIPAIFEEVTHFENDIARVQVKSGEGFIDKKGNYIIQPIYEKQRFIVTGFSGYLAKVKQNGKYGFINRNGKTIIPFIYDDAGDFSSSEISTAIVTLKDHSGIIDQQGNFILPLMYKYLSGPTDGLYKITPEDIFDAQNVKYIDESGQVIHEIDKDKKCKYGFFKQGLCPYYDTKLRKYGYINKKSEIVINPLFEEADVFINGLAKVTLGEKQKTVGYINRTGKFILSAIYDDGTFLPLPDMVVVKLGNWGIVNLKGEFIVPPIFEDLIVGEQADYIGFKKNGKWGFLTVE